MNKKKIKFNVVYVGEIVICFSPGGYQFKTYEFIYWSPASVNELWGVVTNVFCEEPGDGR